jgi:hypothetical protein
VKQEMDLCSDMLSVRDDSSSAINAFCHFDIQLVHNSENLIK